MWDFLFCFWQFYFVLSIVYFLQFLFLISLIFMLKSLLKYLALQPYIIWQGPKKRSSGKVDWAPQLVVITVSRFRSELDSLLKRPKFHYLEVFCGAGFLTERFQSPTMGELCLTVSIIGAGQEKGVGYFVGFHLI